MCTTCGCSGVESRHQEEPTEPTHKRLIEVEKDLLSKNNRYAEANRTRLSSEHTLALNLVSSPGAGKTTLLVETIHQLTKDAANPIDSDKIAVIEGDQQTDNDAKRIAATGAFAHQINTGKGCHLDAHAVGHGIDHFDLNKTELLFIENVGNLVCPAAFDLGEYAKVVVLSVTEGEDKPLKYPDMFKAASLMLINKIDLLPYVDFDVKKTIEYALRINPSIRVIELSAKTGEGMQDWKDWLQQSRHEHC